MSQQSRTDDHPVTPRDHIVGLFQERSDHAHQLLADVTGEDETRILTRLPPSRNASAVLTQMWNLCAGDDNYTHITEENILLLKEENESMKQRLEDLESQYGTKLLVVADKHWHLQISHYAANTLLPLSSLSTEIFSWMTWQIHSPLEIPTQSILKLTGWSVVSFWMTYKNDVLVGIKRKRSNVQESVSRGSKVGYQFWCNCIELTMTNESHLLDTVQTMRHNSKEQYIRRRNKILSNPHRNIIATSLQMADKQAATNSKEIATDCNYINYHINFISTHAALFLLNYSNLKH